MLSATPRSYLLTADGGFGGNTRSSDTHIWYHLRDSDVEEVEKSANVCTRIHTSVVGVFRTLCFNHKKISLSAYLS